MDAISCIDSSIEISGSDLADLRHVVDDFDVKTAAGQAARRAQAAKLRQCGFSVSKAKKRAVDAKPTPEMLDAAKQTLGRGGSHEDAVKAAMSAAKMGPGRPPLNPGDPLKSITVRLPASVAARLRDLAAQRGESQGAVIAAGLARL